MKKDFAFLSCPHSKIVNGIKVKKLTIGELIEKTSLVSDALEKLLDLLFPGASAMGILRALSRVEAEELKALLRRAALTAPSAIIELISVLLDADKDVLLALSPFEMTEVLSELEKENRLADFLQAVREIAARMRTATATGCKG